MRPLAHGSSSLIVVIFPPNFKTGIGRFRVFFIVTITHWFLCVRIQAGSSFTGIE